MHGSSYRIEVDGVSHRVERDDGGVVHAPAPAVVVSIAVKPGDIVAAGDRLAVVEAMKMEMQVVAPFSGKFARSWRYRTCRSIPGPRSSRSKPQADVMNLPVDRSEWSLDAADRLADTASWLHWRQSPGRSAQLMLGFDVDPAQTARLAQWSSFAKPASDAAEMRREEDEILNIFVDIWSLFRRKPAYQ